MLEVGSDNFLLDMIYQTTIKTYEIEKLCKQMKKTSVERDFWYDNLWTEVVVKQTCAISVMRVHFSYTHQKSETSLAEFEMVL